MERSVTTDAPIRGRQAGGMSGDTVPAQHTEQGLARSLTHTSRLDANQERSCE